MKFNLLKKLTINLIIILILISLNFVLGSHYQENWVNVLWNSDDALYISIADSFRKEKTFNQQVLSTRYFQYSPEEIVKLFKPFPNNPQGITGPIHYILLAGFYSLLSTSHEDLYLHASVFSQIVSSVFIVLFFFLVKRKFDLKIAITSSFLILLSPYFILISTRVLLEPLLYVFSICAFYFLENKKSHYIMFGVFAALAHLTTPNGLILIFSYLPFLLLKREIKGVMTVFITWTVLLIPWFVRNYYSFKNIGAGLYLPFSNKISQLINFIMVDNINVEPDKFSYFPSNGIQTTVSQVISASYEQFGLLYKTDLLLIFVLLFAGIAFFNIDRVKNKIIITLKMQACVNS